MAGEALTLRTLIDVVRSGDAVEIALDAETRRALLGEFLELPQERAVLLGRYEMGNGEWKLFRTPRHMTRITRREK